MIFNRILVAIDGSQRAQTCLDYALELQHKFDAQIYILSVFRHHSALESSLSMAPNISGFPDNALQDYARSIVEDAKAYVVNKSQGNQQIKAFIKTGPPARTIIDFAKDKNIDLVIIGSRGESDKDGFLLGSISHKVTSLCPCPCLTV